MKALRTSSPTHFPYAVYISGASEIICILYLQLDFGLQLDFWRCFGINKVNSRLAKRMMGLLRLITFITVVISSGWKCTFADVNTCTDETSDLFINEPTDIVVREGDNATLSCSISSYDTEDERIEWEISPDIYETTITDSNDDRPNIKTSTVTVYNVGRTEQHFRCRLSFSASSALHETGKCHRSRIASTTVLYFPRENEISCGSNHVKGTRPVMVGDVFQGRCEVSRGNPPVDIGWATEDGHNLVPQIESITEEGLMRVSELDLHVLDEFFSKSLACIVTSKLAFPDRKLKCGIGPLVLFQEPSDNTISTSYLETATEAVGTLFPSTLEPLVTASSYTFKGKSSIVIMSVSGSTLLLCSIIAIACIIKHRTTERSRDCRDPTMALVPIPGKSNQGIADHLYEEPDVDDDGVDHFEIRHTYFVNTLPPSLSTSPSSFTYISEVRSSDEGESYQPSNRFSEITNSESSASESPCSSVDQNHKMIDMHLASGKRSRQRRSSFRQLLSDHLNVSPCPLGPVQPKLLERVKATPVSHVIKASDTSSSEMSQSLRLLFLSVLSGHALSQPISPCSNSPSSSSGSVSPLLSSSLQCHLHSPSRSRSMSLPTLPDSTARSPLLFP